MTAQPGKTLAILMLLTGLCSFPALADGPGGGGGSIRNFTADGTMERIGFHLEGATRDQINSKCLTFAAQNRIGEVNQLVMFNQHVRASGSVLNTSQACVVVAQQARSGN